MNPDRTRTEFSFEYRGGIIEFFVFPIPGDLPADPEHSMQADIFRR